ncbi:sulfurtransferase TusA family protein [Thiomicrorhabdus sp. Milos-T2]|uniref:sulfurtransferase TusA family protein n=1 Tax=Thiomicrorhabdus sp. Milos-T2 TaxID=90814 RepID=UPI00068DCD8B|nr:sulfurtransferase TusA family protein [Thiomicrorhabdus sp. Milos-T2]
MTTQNNQTAEFKIDHQVDAKGLKCPMPVIKLQQQVRSTRPGKTIEIICTDPGAEKDIASWCKVNKHQLLTTNQHEDNFSIIIEVKGRS